MELTCWSQRKENGVSISLFDISFEITTGWDHYNDDIRHLGDVINPRSHWLLPVDLRFIATALLRAEHVFPEAPAVHMRRLNHKTYRSQSSSMIIFHFRLALLLSQMSLSAALQSLPADQKTFHNNSNNNNKTRRINHHRCIQLNSSELKRTTIDYSDSTKLENLTQKL